MDDFVDASLYCYADGAADDTESLRAALAAALASPSRHLHLPAGTYRVTLTSGVLLDAAADGVRITGEGIGRSVIRWDADLAFTGDVTAVRVTAARAMIHDLSIVCGENVTFSPGKKFAGVTLGADSTHCAVDSVEIAGACGGGPAGGGGVLVYRPWNLGGGRAFHRVRDCLIRDGASSCGIVLNARSCLLEGNVILRCGDDSLRHGIYVQGGDNRIVGNHIERAGGYSLHAHKAVPHIDGSGDIYEGNWSIDPGHGHFVIDSIDSHGTNPEVPAGVALTRNVVVRGNVFRGGRPGNSYPAVAAGVPAIIEGNVFEDVKGPQLAGAGFWLHLWGGAAGSLVRGNQFRAVLASAAQAHVACVAPDCVIEGNSFVGLCGQVSAIGPRCRVAGNIALLAPHYGGVVFTLAGPDGRLCGNTAFGGAANAKFVAWHSSGYVIDGNRWAGHPASWFAIAAGTKGGALAGNDWSGTYGLRLSGETS